MANLAGARLDVDQTTLIMGIVGFDQEIGKAGAHASRKGLFPLRARYGLRTDGLVQ